jgi:CO/xanthine dehydrogenase Mo-binding subunit
MKTAHNAPERAERLGVDEVSIRLRTLAHGGHPHVA